MSLNWVIPEVQNWKPKSETRFLRWGTVGLTVMSGASAVYINNYYRKCMRLRSFGLIGSYCSIGFVSVVCNSAFRDLVISRGFLEGTSNCATCLNMRATATQTAHAVVFPVLLGAFLSFHLAEQNSTHKLPPLYQDWRFWLNTFRLVSKPMLGKLGALVLVNAAAASIVTHMEARQLNHVLENLYNRQQLADTVSQ